MSFTPDSILALLALIVMLAPAARYIFRFLQRRRRSRRPADVETVRAYTPKMFPRSDADRETACHCASARTRGPEHIGACPASGYRNNLHIRCCAVAKSRRQRIADPRTAAAECGAARASGRLRTTSIYEHERVGTDLSSSADFQSVSWRLPECNTASRVYESAGRSFRHWKRNTAWPRPCKSPQYRSGRIADLYS